MKKYINFFENNNQIKFSFPKLKYSFKLKNVSFSFLQYNFVNNNLKKLVKKNFKQFYFFSKYITLEMSKKTFLKKIEIIKPGSININKIKIQKKNKSVKKLLQNSLIIDYGGANIAKLLHIGHIRCILLGNLIYNIKTTIKHKVVSDIHLGDLGTQAGIILLNNKKTNNHLIKNFFLSYYSIPVLSKNYTKIIKQKKVNIRINKYINKKILLLQKNNPHIRFLWLYIRQISIKELKLIYKKFYVFFDLWNSESSIQYLIKHIILKLWLSKKIQTNNKAIIISIKKLIPIILLKSTGATLYSTSDVTTITERKVKYLTTKILYIVDNRQNLYFKQLGGYLIETQHTNNIINNLNFEHINFGTINDFNKKPFKTRKGAYINLTVILNLMILIINILKNKLKTKLQNILQKLIILSLIKFDILSYPYQTDYNFVYTKIITYEGKTGIYLVYTLLRIRSLFRQTALYVKKLKTKKLNTIEKTILFYIMFINYKAIKITKLHKITLYAYKIATKINKLYNTIYVKAEKIKTKKIQSLFVYYVGYKTIKNILKLLNIKIPLQI